MDRRKSLTEAMATLGMTIPQYAAHCGVSQSVIYKFLQGLDLRLSTWDRIDPSRLPQGPPGHDANLPARRPVARIIS